MASSRPNNRRAGATVRREPAAEGTGITFEYLPVYQAAIAEKLAANYPSLFGVSAQRTENVIVGPSGMLWAQLRTEQVTPYADTNLFRAAVDAVSPMMKR